MYFLKFMMPPIGGLVGFSIWNLYTYYYYNYFNNQFKSFKYDIIYTFSGYLLFPTIGFYLGMNIKKFNLLPYYCKK